MIFKKSEYVKGGTSPEHFPTDLPQIMLCGRSNVGKSSFINGLLNKKNLAHTSSKPGKTQVLNFFNINDLFYLVDVPGYGYAYVDKKTRESFGEMIEGFIARSTNLRKVFLLVDFRIGPTNDDVLMFNFLKYYNKDIVIIATKYDKVKKSQIYKQEKLIRTTLNLADEPLIVVSSETKYGFDKVNELLDKEFIENLA